MKSKKVVFWGATGQARMLRETVSYDGYELVALFDNNPEVESPFSDIPVLSGREGFRRWKESSGDALECAFLVAIGSDRGRVRVEIHEFLESEGLVPLVAKHPTAYVASSAKVGSGSQILPGATVCVDAELGRQVIINTQASVDHECRLGEGVHLCPGVRLAGCVEIEKYATLYTGAIVIPRIRIGEGAVVGAGAVVIRDVEPYTVVVGNPARAIKSLVTRT